MSLSRVAHLCSITAATVAGGSVFIPSMRPTVTWLWLASIAFGLMGFIPPRDRAAANSTTERESDLWTAGCLVMAFLPLYTLFVYWHPFAINTDEVNIMASERAYPQDPALHLWSTSHYFGFPAFVFIVQGWIGSWTGGVDLSHMRLLHACSGLAIIALTYALFRATLPRFQAALGTVVLGAGHALVTISRMAMRDNSALLSETAAMAVLWRAYQRRCPMLAAAGGMLTGLGCYVYYPARITAVLWFLFCLCTILRPAAGMHAGTGVRLLASTVFGFVLVASPLALDTWRTSPQSTQFMRQSSLLHTEGLELQRQWVSAKTVEEGVLANIRQGLTTFNRELPDHSNIYPNWHGHHGFVDPLTGVLLWIGIVVVISSARFHGLQREFDVFATGCFLFLWLLFSFVVNKAPNYTRLLVILPFVAYLVTRALEAGQLLIERALRSAPGINAAAAGRLGAGLVVAAIVASNLIIFTRVMDHGFRSGDDLGGIGRYIEGRKDSNGATYFIVASQERPVFSWGPPEAWQAWARFFTGPGQRVTVLQPERMLDGPVPRPASYLMGRSLWESSRERWLRDHPELILHEVTPDGRLLAVEIP